MIQTTLPVLRSAFLPVSKSLLRLPLEGRSLRATSTSAAVNEGLPVAYSKGTSYLHWMMALGIGTCFASVQGAMNTKDNALKGQLMTIHKSTGLLVAGLTLPRIALALLARRPGPLPGAPGMIHSLEHFAASASHLALYFFMAALPSTGIAMGYYGGKGLPFFGYTIPGASKPDGAIAKQAFGWHKKTGQAFEYFVPVHVGAAGLHALRGQAIFSRINPFA